MYVLLTYNRSIWLLNTPCTCRNPYTRLPSTFGHSINKLLYFCSFLFSHFVDSMIARMEIGLVWLGLAVAYWWESMLLINYSMLFWTVTRGCVIVNQFDHQLNWIHCVLKYSSYRYQFQHSLAENLPKMDRLAKSIVFFFCFLQSDDMKQCNESKKKTMTQTHTLSDCLILNWIVDQIN